MEILTAAGWRPVDRVTAPQIVETDTLSVRGARPGSVIGLGGIEAVTADAGGSGSVRLADLDDVRGHIGLLTVAVDTAPQGEIEVLPGKMSEVAYRILRAELNATWSGLVLDPAGTSALQAGPPPPEELWRRISGAVARIVDRPAERLVSGQAQLHARQVRRGAELTPALLRATYRDAAAVVRTVRASTALAENDMVVDTLHRLASYAVTVGDTATSSVVTSFSRRLQSATGPTTNPATSLWRPPPYATLDERYRQVDAVRQLLQRPDLEPVEGPGELRWGVRGLERLYEYWVYLRVLMQVRTLLGEPVGDGLNQLRTVTTSGVVRLELPRGTTVSFPGDVHVGFEPEIRVTGHSWRGLRLVPHPDPQQRFQLATPDVVVLVDGPVPKALVLDAKYVGRTWVEDAAVKTHAKYARMTKDGAPTVTGVVVVHPHPDVPSMHWAGYGHQPMTPGVTPAQVPLRTLLPPGLDQIDPGGQTATEGRPVNGAAPGPLAARQADPNRRTMLVVHQEWMRRHLGDARVDLSRLLGLYKVGTGRVEGVIVMPDLFPLRGFGLACERAGWTISRCETGTDAQREAVMSIATDAIATGARVVCFTDLDLAALDDRVRLKSALPQEIFI